MTIYIVVFCISTVIFKLADYVKKEQRKYIDILAILLLCLFAGFRSEAVGTDTRGYIQPMIKAAISSDSMENFLQHSWVVNYALKKVASYEFGFTLVVYFMSVIFKSIVATQFVLELLVILPVYYALRIKKDVPVWFGMLVFMLQFFNGSMNLLRQSIAMAFVLLAITFWMQGNKKKSALLIAVSILFHTSGLISILILFIYEYVGGERKGEISVSGEKIGINYINMVIVIIAGLVALVGTQVVATILIRFGLDRYVNYILGNIRFMPNQIISVLPPFAMFILSYKHYKDSKKEWIFYFVMFVYTMFAGQFTSVNSFGGRVKLYFMIFGIHACPLACKYSRNKKIFTTLMISYLTFYWWFYYVFNMTDQTVPYIMIR